MNHAGEVYPEGFPVDTLTGVGVGWEGLQAPPKALAIVGSHPATRELAPYEDPRFEIWLYNESPQKPEVYRRWDASFQMHKPEVYASEQNWVNKDHWAWLQQDHGDKRIWMMDADERVPNSVRYPIEEVQKLVPYKYLRSTPALALALAIHLGYREIWIYGSELSSNTEYGYQAINYAFWIGFAHGYGVDLHLECWQSEFNQPIYGYEGELQVPQSFFELRIDDIELSAELNQKAMETTGERFKDAVFDGKFEKAAEVSIKLQDIAIKAGEAAGALSEARRYSERTNPISRQEFERVSAQAQIDGDKAKSEMNHEGGKCEYVWNAWRQRGMTAPRDQFLQFVKQKTEYAFKVGWNVGVMRENLQYLNEYDNLITAAGGQRAVSQAEKVLNREIPA